MVRHRVTQPTKAKKSDRSAEEPVSAGSDTTPFDQQAQMPKDLRRNARRRNRNASDDSNAPQLYSKEKLLYYATIVGLVAFVGYYVYLGYLETRIYTPLAEEKVVQKTGLAVPDKFWGSYRSGIYFGLKHRSSKSVVAGLMWLLPSQIRPRNVGLRHLCQQDDNLRSYGWVEHDGTNFGVQEIYDNEMKITTSFVKKVGGANGGDWTARISVEPLTEVASEKDNIDEIVLSFYIALESGVQGSVDAFVEGDKLSTLYGNTSDLGSFEVTFLDGEGYLQASHLETSIQSLNDISRVTLESMASKRMNGKWIYVLNGHNAPKGRGTPNLFIHQVHAKGPFTMEISFESGSFYDRQRKLVQEEYTKALNYHRIEFAKKFESTFHLKAKQFNDSSVKFAQAALSNMVGGIGYFYGNSKVQSVYNNVPVPYWPAALYSAVPSRSFFPRGFLWDEGFHLLLINKWDPAISVDIISHWLDLMNTEGWIPREQILGEEALVRVPEEFVVQRNDVANPPTLILAIYDLLTRHQQWLLSHHKASLYRMWPRLVTWYGWLNKTQIGDIPTTYRWRGRNSTTKRELNPKTLASGLDDYPRASHPTDSERHLDLRCWIAMASKLMANLAALLGFDAEKYDATFASLTDLKKLDSLHWSKELNSYTDYGLHSPNVVLRRVQKPDSEFNTLAEKERIVVVPPKYSFVNMFGYVNLFPMLLEILPPESDKLIIILNKLQDPNLLWTPYGLRSLAANAPLYNARNTEHDPPYWRGPVWININFLALKALKHYAEAKGPATKLASEIYERLRNNVVGNVMKQYYKTGYIWEQYNDATGDGKGCRPFTGWSALVVLMMAEEY